MTAKIDCRVDGTRQLLTFIANDSSLRSQVKIAVSGKSLKRPLPEDSLTAEVRKKFGLQAFENLLTRLCKTTSELEAAQQATEIAQMRYRGSIVGGGDGAKQKDDWVAACDRLEGLRVEYATLRSAAEEARGVAVEGIDEFFRKQNAERFDAATRRYDASVARIAESIKAELPELAEARAEWQLVGREKVDADKIVPPLPAPPVNPADEHGQREEPAMMGMSKLSTIPMGHFRSPW